MEGILTEYVALGPGVFLGALTLLVLVLGGISLGSLTDEEKRGKRLFWAEWPLPESEPHVPDESEVLRAA